MGYLTPNYHHLSIIWKTILENDERNSSYFCGDKHTMDQEVAYYIQQLNGSEMENAFHRLLEIDDSLVSDLIEAYHNEPNPHKRLLILEIIGEHRRSSDVEFFAEILRSGEAELWKSVLDALVKINHPDCLKALTDEKERLRAAQDNLSHLEWIEEAIQQLTF